MNYKELSDELLIAKMSNYWLIANTTTIQERQEKYEDMYFKLQKELLRRLKKENE